ncbi:sigma-54-dependent transcriptional regulator [Granulicella tundricola]|nr:sigma-54 dependent transcriptional regulator [Granulicella tundricola]
MAVEQGGIAPGPAWPERMARGEEGVHRMASEVQRGRLGGSEGQPVLHLLVVEDNASIRAACLEIASNMAFSAVGAPDMKEAEEILRHQAVDVLLLNLKIPGGGGMDLLERVKKLQPDTVVIAMTAAASVSSAVEAMRVGAAEYLTKPFALEELTSVLENAGARRQFDLESRRLRERLRSQRGVGNLIGHSPEMEKLYRILSKVAHTSHPVLIVGERGTGKELVGKTIHSTGLHAQRQFTPVDCESLAPEMIENELFGFVKGAFAGAIRNKAGLLATLEGGTVFLDEISELPLELQGKLVRALQDREVWPMGASHPVPLTARILASTSRNLVAMVEAGRFRRDLYFRLNVVNLRIPALRERQEDIPVLAMHTLSKAQRDQYAEKEFPRTFSDDVLRLFLEYEWPGNVRELEAVVERACAVSSGPVVNLGDLPSPLQEFWMQGRSVRRVDLEAEADQDLGHIVSMAEVEKKTILTAIQMLNGDKLKAAKVLGIGKTTLYRKLKEYGLGEGPERDED